MRTRRHVLELLATTPFLATCGGDDLPDPVAAWRDPGAGESDPRRYALAHAILAPNPHNTQPWLVELDGEDAVTLWCDLERRLPFTDPLDRQITIGCGAFMYLCWHALGRHGDWNMEIFPDGAPQPGARLDARPLARWTRRSRQILGPDGPQTYLAQLTQRRTNRSIYDARVPAAADLNEVLQGGTQAMMAPPTGPELIGGGFTTDGAQVARLRDLVWRAFERESTTPGALEETFKWLRFGRSEIARHRDGLSIDGPMIPLLKATGQFSHDQMINPGSMANQSAASDWRKKADSSPAFLWLTTPDDSALARIFAGMAYVRANLATTRLGLAMHPWSQALQEYEEMADLYAEARHTLGVGETETVQMLVRIGYADPVEPAPRRGFEALLRPA